MFGRQEATLNLIESDGKVSGTFVHPKLGALTLYDGSFADDGLNVKCDTNDGPMQMTLQVSGSGLGGSWKAGVWSGSVQLTRR